MRKILTAIKQFFCRHKFDYIKTNLAIGFISEEYCCRKCKMVINSPRKPYKH